MATVTQMMIAALRTDDVPDVCEAVHLSFLLTGEHEVQRTITEHMSDGELRDRLERKMQLWFPVALENLRTTWKYGIETWFTMICEARRQFPETIGPLISDGELATLRREAHIRAAREAIGCLSAAGCQHHQYRSCQDVLVAALLAGATKAEMGNPPPEYFGEMSRYLPKYVHDNGTAWGMRNYQLTILNRARELNRHLNGHLRRAPKAA